MNQLEQMLGNFFLAKMPGLSGNVKVAAAKVMPWIMIVFGALGLLAWLSSLGLFFGYAGLAAYAPGHTLSVIFMALYLILAPIIQIMAIYGGYLMLSRQRKGWNIVFYALLIGVISHLCSLSILGILLDVVFGYLLFQIKEYYPESLPG